jgi:hypothetical protein
MRLTALVLFFFLVNGISHSYAAESFHPCLQAGIKKSVIFIGTFQKPQPTNPSGRTYFGTGFLTSVDKIFYLFTAKHVVEGFRSGGGKDEQMFIFLNGQDGKLRVRPVADIKKVTGADWVFGKTSDIAVLPFVRAPDFDLKTGGQNMFLELPQLPELQDLFFISFQPGIEDPNAITPIMRRGMVSIINSDQTFYMDAFAFPGNSGSPVFSKPSPTTFSEKGLTFGDPLGCKFVGIIGEYLAYREVAVSEQTKKPRIVFEENTGLARVWSVDALQEVIKSSPFQTQHKRILDMVSKRELQ